MCFWILAGEDIHSPKDGMSLGHKSKAFTFSSSALKYSVREEKKGGGVGRVEGVGIQKKNVLCTYTKWDELFIISTGEVRWSTPETNS